MNFREFFKKSFYLFVFYAILLTFLTLFNVLSGNVWAAWLGLIIAFLNSIGGAASISWGYEKSEKEFYGAFFGGMLLRFILIFIILFILIKLFRFNQIVLIISLLFTYFSFLVLEIWGINQYAAIKGK